MGKRNQTEGGFAYLNSNKGVIKNCYAAVRMNGRKHENAGFVYDNRGTVSHCFVRSRTSRWKQSRKDKGKKKDGFCSFNDGFLYQDFFLVKKKQKLKDYRDSKLGLAISQASGRFL